MEDYGAMLQQDGVDPQALKGTSTGPAGGGSGVHRAAEHEEEGQGDMAEESQFGLSPDKSSQDFLTQQLETQPPASQQGQASPAGTSAGKRKALGASGHKDDGNGGQGEATPQTRSPKKPRRADNVVSIGPRLPSFSHSLVSTGHGGRLHLVPPPKQRCFSLTRSRPC